MGSASNGYLRACRLLLPVFLAVALLTVAIDGRKEEAATPGGPPDDWDVPQLVAYLNGKGLGVRAVPTVRDGAIRDSAFLTTTSQPWNAFNRLRKDPEQIDQWQGTLYCERAPHWESWGDPFLQGGDCCLVVGPFFLFGDPALLGRVRDALSTAGRP
jgi:hypothetical protein